jgi:hypothetical protein
MFDVLFCSSDGSRLLYGEGDGMNGMGEERAK